MTSPTASSSSATRAARKRCTRDGCRKLARPGRKRCDDHKPGAPGNPAKRGPGGTRRPPARPRLLGRTEPRICSAQPRRPLTRKTTRGYEVIEFAEMAGEPLLPWQQWAAKHALELNPDGTYRFRVVIVLVARQNGKSHLKRMISLWRLYMDGARRIVGAAQDLSLARDQWQMCQDTIHNCPELETEWGNVRNVNGDEYFWLANGARYAIKATNRKAGRGGSNDEVNIDELREQRDWAAWGALSKTTNARARAQIWLMSNAGDDESVVLNQLCDKAIAGGDDGGEILLLEWSAPKGCELDDTGAWCYANPGLGYIVSEAAIRLALNDPPEVFRTEVLCQRVEKLDWAIDPGAWKDGADPSGTMDGLRDRLAAVFDAAPDGQHFTLGVAAKRSDGRIRVEIVQAWTSTAAVRAELPGLLARVRPRAFCWFPSGPAAELGTVLRPLALKYNFRPGTRQASDVPLDGELKGVKVTEVCQEFGGLVRARAVVHADQDLLNDHVFGASKLWTGDGWRFMRKGAGHCDAAYVAAGCVCTALVLPERKIAKIRVLA
jgi:hypothetical protein